ncbi:MAG TPA: bifunctional UDP-N-acetylglucosamine diphosphorylase/glucosamine-1-phosphate N-acetyltransferase GlmU [Rhodospirillaceae bacterium]|nr:bifunctional N-acetylglucosamine-1-phosphate uridyltransferase/glucosamine-1-phosphate acetyltransferase [Rhodospirillaceae bacterium]HAT35553.1 bifunctional UDP-N-acetylglucosamine diphosphorylase/glucosamine-1-phosphate N-acetyltransferase GlmU [Rhodospirillaceae bacterium]
MSDHKTIAVVLAAGKGTRMKSALPKVLHPLAGKPMVGHVLAAAEALGPEKAIIVVGPDMEVVEAAVAPHQTVRQKDRLGTADAVKCALPSLADTSADTVLILYGDTPLIRPETLGEMLSARAEGAALVVLGFTPDHPGAYGRLKLSDAGALEAIVEAKDASPDELEIKLCNSGVMAVEAAHLADLLAEVDNENAKGEFYLTDIVGLARQRGLTCSVVEAPAEELMGVDSRAALAEAEAVWQANRRAQAMADGVTMLDPATVWFSYDTELGRDVVIGPNIFFGPGVTVADDVEIRAFSHLEGVSIGESAVVGPFARLRPGAVIEKGAFVGNFVEVKNAVLGEGAKASHLSYIGDAMVGAKANIGAGTITCNYDGYAKHKTVIGKSAFIGSNTALVAPVKVGDGAVVGAGSTVVSDVVKDALALARGKQINLPGRAKALREKLAAAKKTNTKKKE